MLLSILFANPFICSVCRDSCRLYEFQF